MKDSAALITAILIVICAAKIGKLERQAKLTKEQIEVLTIYCKAMPKCRKEMEK